jgi:hypothetical protein
MQNTVTDQLSVETRSHIGNFQPVRTCDPPSPRGPKTATCDPPSPRVVSLMSTTIDTINIDLIVKQLRTKPRFADWTENRFALALAEYKNFLQFCKAHPDKTMGFSDDMDEIWHQHILNTEKYADDCNHFFGFYFHHRPHLN